MIERKTRDWAVESELREAARGRRGKREKKKEARSERARGREGESERGFQEGNVVVLALEPCSFPRRALSSSYGADHRRLEHGRSSTDETIVGEKKASGDNGRLGVDPSLNPHDPGLRSPSQTREEAHRLDDDLAVLQAERQVSRTEGEAERAGRASSVRRSRSRRTEPVDEFDAATNPLHEQSAVFKPPENPTTSFARFVKKVHNSSFLVRYFTYITPLVLILLIPLLVGALAFPDADVGGVSLMWFAVWLEIFWLTLWAGRIVAKCIPVPVGIVAGVFTNNAKKWRDLAKQLEFPATLFFWWLAVEISFLPTMKNHHIDGNKATKHWELVVNKIIISIFVGTTLNFIEKIIIQLIAISFHLRTYADRIELNKFQIGSLTKLYDFSKKKITMEDRDFEERPKDGRSSGTRTPMMYADRATRVAREALHKELEAACVEIGRERKSITASLKDLDSVVSKLDDVFVFIVVIITILVFLSLISTSAAGVLASAGSTLLALSWLFSATAQEFLQSIIFVFVKHPFDVGDRVSIYGNTGANLTGDDYFVKEIALLYTEFKKMEGHVVQAPNSYLNTLFILNQRRSGGLAEAVPIIIKFGTTLQQIDALRQRLLEFVLSEKREYQSKVLTELRQVTENYSITLNVVFFYKSNWQNELLRLQRRNKFICNLMISLQEVGIEGPRMNLVGYTTDLPYHVAQGGSAQPTPTGDESSNSPPPPPAADPQQLAEARDALGELGGGYSTGVHPRPSILRRPGASTRGRGDSINKHVDFSLGMSELSSADMMSDVYADRERNRVDDIIRSANRESAERRIQEQQERESLERSRSQQYRPSIDSHRSGMGSTTSSVHRNRFFGRLGGRAGPHQHSTRGFQGDDDMMEQGQYAGLPTNPEESLAKMDPRTGNVSSRAVHDDELGRQRTGSDAELMQARSSDRVSEEYEMGRLGGRP
ncbi:MS ion channel protein 1 [Coccidioides immitis RMSCC 2394]|uniref:MS ion channel protein 1 n=1 Tax=Coccidioides immitis RMSCC 2394 TaxID=404692 RepID=A0A0J6XYL5_COCIT|nr:MS ion channel protein 1 [Coccidioides immitis RMSCC 2394]